MAAQDDGPLAVRWYEDTRWAEALRDDDQLALNDMTRRLRGGAPEEPRLFPLKARYDMQWPVVDKLFGLWVMWGCSPEEWWRNFHALNDAFPLKPEYRPTDEQVVTAVERWRVAVQISREGKELADRFRRGPT